MPETLPREPFMHRPPPVTDDNTADGGVRPEAVEVGSGVEHAAITSAVVTTPVGTRRAETRGVD
jgi:hypothetical protein